MFLTCESPTGFQLLFQKINLYMMFIKYFTGISEKKQFFTSIIIYLCKNLCFRSNGKQNYLNQKKPHIC